MKVHIYHYKCVSLYKTDTAGGPPEPFETKIHWKTMYSMIPSSVLVIPTFVAQSFAFQCLILGPLIKINNR